MSTVMVGEPALVQRVRGRLEQLFWLRAAAWGASAGIVAWLAAAALLQRVSRNGAALPAERMGTASTLAAALVALLAAACTTWTVRRRQGAITRTRAALWLEEQFPALQYALVTLTDVDALPSSVSDSVRARLVATIGEPDVGRPLRTSARRQLTLPLVVVVLLALASVPVHALLDGAERDALAHDTRTGQHARGSSTRPTKALSSWRVRVTPPAYSGLEPVALGDASLVTALVGSQVDIAGNDAQAPEATRRSTGDSVTTARLAVTSGGDGWHTQLAMPAAPAELRFVLDSVARQLLLESRADSLPVVGLQLPLHDSVYRAPKGAVVLEANAHDDLALASASFELIVTSGEGERFTARTVLLAPQRPSGARELHWRTSLLLDTMKLEAGDIVHMRAVARDRHPDAAREAGTSETRTFRIARASEYDSVAVEPAPPPEVQKSLMSQRMLLILTEKLEGRRPGLARPVLVSESRALANEQVRLRKTVGELVFQRLEGEGGAEHQHFPGDGHDHGVNLEQGKLVPTQAAAAAAGGPPLLDSEGDESPLVGVNKPLLEAYNAMWDAASALDVADPKGAIPHMRLALAAIERARLAERIYLRGKPPVVIVDVAKVRLAGKDTGQANTRAAREAVSPAEAAREGRLLAAALLMVRDVDAARDSLAVLRLESVADQPRLAAAIGDALDIMRRGGDVTPALVRARRLLGSGSSADSLGRWR